ncbi:gag/pol protein [Cucumis melo var. makuwa]|uniref:Gag/pol protein n=1 Tax=Cucumis melo var. makuwa TaxID=1194695 RepID=A0A5A7TWB7_CUCMM|nr:gag/pol protein [Cucumis melo var. makuwa]
MNGAIFDEKSQVPYILKFLPKKFLQFCSNTEMNKIEYNMTTLLKELQTFQSFKGQKVGEENVVHCKRFVPLSSRSKKIQKKKGGKGKGPTTTIEGKGKAKETSSLEQLEEDEMTLKVGTRDIISAPAVGDAK